MLPQLPPRGALKLKEAATLYSVSVSSLRRKITGGKLRVCREFRHILVTVEALEALFNPKPASNKREGPA